MSTLPLHCHDAVNAAVVRPVPADPLMYLWQSAAGQWPTTLPACTQRFVKTFLPGSELLTASSEPSCAPDCALPVAISRHWGVSVARLPVNEWMKCGDLLVRGEDIRPEALTQLAKRLLDLDARLYDFQWVRDDNAWRCLVEALQNRGCHVDKRPLFEVGLIDIVGGWDDYWKTRSKNFRRQMNAAWKGLGEFGPVGFERHLDIGCPDHLNRLLDEAISIEHRGWKGESGTSIRSRPDMEEFFKGIAHELNCRGLLELQFLRTGGRAVAFEWGYRRNGIYYSHKVGYDPEFSKFSPGQVLVFAQLQEFFARGDVHQVDTMGIQSQASARWTTGSYPMHRYRISSPRILDRWAWSAVCQSRDRLKTLRSAFRKKSNNKPD